MGKTTSAMNLSASLATLEKKTLLIDADPQANASSGLGVDVRKVDCSIYECIVTGADIREAIYTTDVDNLDIVPAHIDLVGAEIEMLNFDEREKVMKKLLDPLRAEYDYILIDCSPSLGLITVNSLVAADSGIVIAANAVNALFNFVGNMRNYLHGTAKVIAAAFFIDYGKINFTGSYVGAFGQVDVDKALVMAKVKVGFRTVVGNKNLAVLVRAHGAGVYVNVRVKLLDGYFITAAF